jgi:hypothetical protein
LKYCLKHLLSFQLDSNATLKRYEDCLFRKVFDSVYQKVNYTAIIKLKDDLSLVIIERLILELFIDILIDRNRNFDYFELYLTFTK